MTAIFFERYGDVQAFTFNRTAQESPPGMTEAISYYMLAYGCYDLMVVANPDGRIVAKDTFTFDGRNLDNSQLIGREVKGEESFTRCMNGDVKVGESYFGDMRGDRDTAKVYQGRGLIVESAAPVSCTVA